MSETTNEPVEYTILNDGYKPSEEEINILAKELLRVKWLVRNLAYCEDTHSFTHRLMNKLNIKIDKVIYQAKAMEVLGEMSDEFIFGKKEEAEE